MEQTSPHTVHSLASDLRHLGLAAGDVVLLHSSMRSLGFVAGGPQAVVQALLDVLGPDGTLVVPTHTPDNSDPAGWRNPPVPAAWWAEIRDRMPGFDPARTPSRWMGVVAETARGWPDAVRSSHPQVSCAALGRHADEIVGSHPLGDPHGERSPLGAVNRLDGRVLLLGCGHGSNTSLHLAETRQETPPRGTAGASVLGSDGVRQWLTWDEVVADEGDFERLGAAFDATGAVSVGRVGEATARLMSQRAVVDFGTAWIAANRGAVRS
ncbi:aminoglycoside N(3)-acetyltransferase [Plantactinospora sp. WMMB782]|uniref:aminoglycoside N(3)-acetyltransferase n=1 Tax=Plantactinospora sp. WMMB782 TaxID=3404121 RepID=UPI003B9336F1